ncbi:complement C2-like isoform X2 [Argiope bruennichi]|uniref:complement C2-like isoform X2 n=1 Tax=Argiope bruennichi TaxID=94029 RepID=UPI00249558BE|nr:complement C2-like isoform X2 [Argiope bruennichi]
MIIPAQVLLVIGSVILISPSKLSAARARQKHAVCPPFPYITLDHGKITPIGTQKYLFKCDPGYFLASPPQVRCWKGKWSSTKEPKCFKAEGHCDDPDPLPGGEILGDERHEGSAIQYMCKPGFILMGVGTRTCLRSGHWSGITPICMDESEPLQNVAERFKEKFVTDVGSHSSDSSVPQGRLLDGASIRKGLELVILIDRSSSIDPEDFKMGIAFIKFLLQEFGVRNGNNTWTRAAVMAFGTKVDILFNLDNETITGPQAASRALDTLKAGGGGTAMQEALMNVFTRLPPLRVQAKRAIFMLTDGEPNIGDVEEALYFAKQLREKRDFEIFTVGIGRGINRQLLAKLASEPIISHVFIMDKYTDLRHVMETISDSSSRPKPINPARCGYIKHEHDYLKRWPWLAAVYINLPNESNSTRFSLCGGTLICSEWILTAASCFYNVYENNATEKVFEKVSEEVFVVMGEKDLIQEDRNQMNFYAEDIIIHPDFQPLDELEHNLALLKLNNPTPLRRFRPACLPMTERPVPLHLDLNTNASIAGWGLLPDNRQKEITGGTVSMRSSNISVALEEESTCDQTNGKETGGNIFCAGGLGTLTCTGDLGSPLIAVDPLTNLHHLIGVLSSRLNCQRGTNQYTQLAKYIKWISEETNDCHSKHYNV